MIMTWRAAVVAGAMALGAQAAAQTTPQPFEPSPSPPPRPPDYLPTPKPGPPIALPPIDDFKPLQRSPDAPDGQRRAVRLQALDKVTTRTREIVVAVGDSVRFGTLRIDAAECLVNTPEATPDSVAFLTITDNKPAQAAEKLFSGWMFASSPALSALDSSVYDVWVLACVTIPQASAPPSSK
ncbi:MAG: DUF2155 domain-containing protein [Reyranellaceae bacterium]